MTRWDMYSRNGNMGSAWRKEVSCGEAISSRIDVVLGQLKSFAQSQKRPLLRCVFQVEEPRHRQVANRHPAHYSTRNHPSS